jgi:hypothetical protein
MAASARRRRAPPGAVGRAVTPGALDGRGGEGRWKRVVEIAGKPALAQQVPGDRSRGTRLKPHRERAQEQVAEQARRPLAACRRQEQPARERPDERNQRAAPMSAGGELLGASSFGLLLRGLPLGAAEEARLGPRRALLLGHRAIGAAKFRGHAVDVDAHAREERRDEPRLVVGKLVVEDVPSAAPARHEFLRRADLRMLDHVPGERVEQGLVHRGRTVAEDAKPRIRKGAGAEGHPPIVAPGGAPQARRTGCPRRRGGRDERLLRVQVDARA